MPLGRFAAYFFLLMAVCLIAFPRAVGAPPPAAARPGSPPSFCYETADGGVTCPPPDLFLSRLRHRRAPAASPQPAALWRLEAGGAALPAPPPLRGREPERRPLDS